MINTLLSEYRLQARLMGSAFEFVITGMEESQAKKSLKQAETEVKRIEEKLTEFSACSQTSAINQAAGQHAVQVDEEVMSLINRSCQISRLTQGAFDITAGALKKLYQFKGNKISFPSSESIQNALDTVGWDKIRFQDNTVYLPKPGMHIAFGAIGKGYAAHRVKALWVADGVGNGVINASGDLTAWGTRADGTPWKVGIANPDNPDTVIAWIPIQNSSVATSGNYEQFFYHEGKRYSHNINPKTGLPVTGIKSVTVVSPGAELSDALATAVTVMGVDIGLHFIDQLPQTHCLIVDDRNKIHTSRSLKWTSHEK
jgi:thiamine biosynthesis lipoprotein